jgi:uncharacterized protein with PIN domain
MKFVCDSMFGKLARMLRMIGYDTIYVRDNQRRILADTDFLEHRMLITKDSKIKNHRIKLFFLKETDPVLQLAALKTHFKLTADSAFTICMMCNHALEPAEKEEIREKLPLMVYNTQEEFTACPSCGRVYWKGSHYDRMKEKIKKIGFIFFGGAWR